MWHPSPTFVSHPEKGRCPQLLRELCSPVGNTAALTTWVVFGPQTRSVLAPLPCQQPSQSCWLAVPSSPGLELGLQCSGAGRSGRCMHAKPLAPAERHYHWSGRSRAVCFEFSFSCQYCYLPNTLTLQCSSGCFRHLNGIDWNPKLSTDECYLPPVLPVILTLELKQQQ